MNTSTVSNFPSDAGASILSALFRASGWAFKQFMHAPVQNTGIAVLSLAMLVSANNALYRQSGTHPAPLFGLSNSAVNAYEAPAQDINAPIPAPPRPAYLATQALAPAQIQPAPAVQSHASPPVSSNIVVGNEPVAQVQRKLAALGLFAGKIDGYYGPVTATAIRAFEQRQGLAPKGALDPEIMAQILAATSASSPQSAAPDPVAHDGVAQPAQPLPDPLATLVQSAANQTSRPVPAAADATANPVVDKATIEKIQRGLASLGFLYGSFDGIAGEATARAIRNFEVYQNFEVTGRVSPDLVDLLLAAGASI